MTFLSDQITNLNKNIKLMMLIIFLKLTIKLKLKKWLNLKYMNIKPCIFS